MFARGPRRANSVFGAVALMVGTAVGAGIFALPYAFLQSGVLVGLIYVVGLGLLLMLVNLSYGEIALSLPGHHQFSGYIEHFLGRRWRWLATCTMLIGLYGALTAYLIALSSFLHTLLSHWIPGSPVLFGFGYAAILGLALGIGLRAITTTEKVMMVVMLVLIGSLIVIALPQVSMQHISLPAQGNWLYPYGIVLFALSAASAVPDMKLVLQQQLPQLKKAIIIGSLLPVLLYALFAVVVVGVTGLVTSDNAITGLGSTLGSWVLTFGSLFACITMTTSFLMTALPLRETFQYDLKASPGLSWLLVMVPPLIILGMQLLSFSEVLGIIGAFVGGVNGILIMHMHRKLRADPNHTSVFTVTQSTLLHSLTYAIFIGGILYESWIIFQRLS